MDLISRQAALEALNWKWAGKASIDAITELPTIDAVPVRHGEWYGEADGYADGELVYDMWYCSFCGKRFEEWDEKPNWNFCPNCGADMRGGNDEQI